MYATEDNEKLGGGRSPVGRKRGKRAEGDNHEDRYMIQNTLRYVGKHSARVYILRLV